MNHVIEQMLSQHESKTLSDKKNSIKEVCREHIEPPFGRYVLSLSCCSDFRQNRDLFFNVRVCAALIWSQNFPRFVYYQTFDQASSIHGSQFFRTRAAFEKSVAFIELFHTVQSGDDVALPSILHLWGPDEKITHVPAEILHFHEPFRSFQPCWHSHEEGDQIGMYNGLFL